MDAARFDALTRHLGESIRSRRAALAFLPTLGIGFLLLRHPLVSENTSAKRSRRRKRRRAGRRAAAEADPRVIGLTCRSAEAKGPVRGQRCGKKLAVAKHHPPHGCCPNSSCMIGTPLHPANKGFCYCNDGYQPVGDGPCEKIPPPPCVGLNVACNARDRCCQDTAGGVICVGDINDPSATYCGTSCKIVDPQKGMSRCNAVADFVAQCCQDKSYRCSNDCQCCGSLRCVSGSCADPPPLETRCHGVGESCADGEPCCDGAGACSGGRCCQSDGAFCPLGCTADGECQACCAGYCRGDSRCGPVAGCLEYGQVCSSGGRCCNDVPCTGGRCRYP